MFKENHLLKNIDIVREIIDFYYLEYSDKNKFEELKKFCKENLQRLNLGGYEESLIDLGYFSSFDFMSFRSSQGITTGIPMNIFGTTVKLLADNNIIAPFEFNLSIHQRYKWFSGIGHFLHQHDLIVNVLFGFPFIAERYKNAVVLIENTSHDGDKHAGTGFYCKDFTGINNDEFVITNKHVVEGSKQVKLFDNKGDEIEYKKIVESADEDLAIIYLKQPLKAEPLIIDVAFDEMLQEIITIGYPGIPTTKAAYQTFHKGEINSLVEQYSSNQELILFSAKTSSGNSGSPVINKYGVVIGMVTEELFDKDAIINKGKLPYYAAIPSKKIASFIVRDSFVME